MMTYMIRLLAVLSYASIIDGQSCMDKSADCSNPAALKRVCNVPSLQDYCQKSCGLCRVNDGQWSEWRVMRPCSVTCGKGLEYLERSCDSQTGTNKGKRCTGSGLGYRICNKQNCPVDGNWSGWKVVSQCSVTCESGLEYMERSCDNPAPANGGAKCMGSAFQVQTCLKQACPVNGNWSDWKVTSQCTVTCGSGLEYMERSCNNPAPANGGTNCIGSAFMHRSCLRQACPVDGNWSGWRVTSSCSVTCGSGLQYMERSCNNPAPSNGGINCTGSAFKHQACVRKACAVPVNGGWSSWRVARTCSKTCGPGTVLMERSCDNPVPKYGGSYCSGQGFSQRTCNLGACPVDGQWSKWGAWGSCSASCNGGYMSRVRSCDNPVPSGGGNQCTGVRRDTKKCNTNDCPSCPHNWKRHNNHCYLIDNVQKHSWGEAREICRHHNGDLVEINDKDESDFLTQQVKYLGGSYFIGANDKARERQFEWTNSGRSLYSTYSNWCPFQPDDDGPVGEDCVILWARCGYKWNDDECFIAHHYICEIAL